ncbi:uncharacterized protein si:dkey-9i23.6 [Myxocyprinus asiaticus]|uniref:uncharacterized protein si:dkey-9i23.6 n=1 Tax=Myxocyprinus asiaticus TaxID=70543 RepID=UPI002222C83F|nr:uncharacterized protein si:dkey-9i23.6 [Myxocyprinus asiaticus]XP_051557867.1 uncharacterized protein si:dkey-9i23.6 [Myxocyprinus asiaticus]
MDRQTVESGKRGDPQTGISLLQAMLMKLSTDKNVHHQKKHNVQSHAHPDTVSESVSQHSLELEGELTNKDATDSDCSVRPDGDEERPTRSETEHVNEPVEEFRGFPEMIPKWERRAFLAISLSEETEEDEPSLEDRENKELDMDEDMAGAALMLNSQSEAPSKQSCESPFQLSMSSERDDLAQMEVKDALTEEACICPPKQGSGTSSILTNQTPVNNTSRTARSASEPVAHKPKEDRPLSAPSISYRQEYEDSGGFANDMSMNNTRKLDKAKRIFGLEDSCMEEGFGVVEHENSVSKMQMKGKKNKMKYLAQKLMARLKEKHNKEHTGSKSINDSEEAQSLSSMETEVEEAVSPPPVPPKKGKYVFLERTFTLKDFKLNLEPIDLMEEIFIGEEWLKYLPSKATLPQKDTGEQSISEFPDNVLHPDMDTQVHKSLLTTEQDLSEDRQYNQSDTDQDNISITQLDNVSKVNRHLHVIPVEPNANIFAIPKALLTNSVNNQRTSGLVCESYNSDVINNCVGVYMIPKHDFRLLDRKSQNVPLDFSTVKSLGLLDNSALKGRIRLSKKRPHRPPKRNKNVKTEKTNTKFYKILPAFLHESTVGASSLLPFSTSPPLHLPPHQPLPMTP